MKMILTIAGTDPCGAAGIQADLQVFRDLGHHGLSVITAVLWQNTQGVDGWRVLDAQEVDRQLDVITRDVSPDAIKIGVLPSGEQAEVVARYAARLKVPVVLDPVMASGDGATSLVQPGALSVIEARLLEHVTVLTPNIPELLTWCGEELAATESLAALAARARARLGVAHLLLKAGHEVSDAEMIHDFVATSDGVVECAGLPRLEIEDVRGTGCHLSSAIAVGLAEGLEPLEAIDRARRYLWDLLHGHARYIGKGRPVIVRACPSPD